MPELPFASANGPSLRPVVRTVADDASSVAGTVFYPMTTDTPPAGGDGDRPSDDDGDDGFGPGGGVLLAVPLVDRWVAPTTTS